MNWEVDGSLKILVNIGLLCIVENQNIMPPPNSMNELSAQLCVLHLRFGTCAEKFLQKKKIL